MTDVRPSLTAKLSGFAIVIAATLMVQWLVTGGYVSAFVLPAPSDVLIAVQMLFATEDLLWLCLITTAMTFIAALLATAVGVPLGWLLSRFPLLSRSYGSWLGAAFSAPVILLYPLFMVLFGRGLHTIVIMGMVVGVIPVVLKTLEGFQSVPRVYLNVAAAFNMTEKQKLLKVMIPFALPTIFTGIRLALIYVMINIIALEFLLSMGGLGFIVSEMYDRFDIPATYAAILLVVLCSVLFFELVERIERWLRT